MGLLIFFEAQLVLHLAGHERGREDRAGHGEEAQGREVVSQVTVQGGVDVPPGLVVQHHRLDLRQRAEHQADVEDLVALPEEMALPREQLLRVGVGEKKGADEEKQDLALVIQQRRVRVLSRRGGVDAVHHGADVQHVGQTRGHLLAQPAQHVGGLVVAEFGVAGAGTGQPRQQDGPGHVKALDLLVPAGLDGVVVVPQRAAVLVDGHPHVVHEEEAVVPELGFGLQEVREGAEGQVGDGRHDDDEEGLGVRVLPKIHPLRELLEPQQEDEGGHQVGPDVDGFVVLLEERGEVIAPGLVHRPVAGVDVGLPEDLRHLGTADSGGGERGQQLRDLPHVDEEAAELFRDGRCHDTAKVQFTATRHNLRDKKESFAVGFNGSFTKLSNRGCLNAFFYYYYFNM